MIASPQHASVNNESVRITPKLYLNSQNTVNQLEKCLNNIVSEIQVPNLQGKTIDLSSQKLRLKTAKNI